MYNRDRDDTATLMVLGCLVVGVLFLGFSLNLLSMASQAQDKPCQEQEAQQVRQHLAQKAEQLASLLEQEGSLNQQIEASQQRLTQEKQQQNQTPQDELGKGREELARLKVLKDHIAAEIAAVEPKVRQFQADAGEGRKQEIEAELQKLLARLAQLKAAILEKERLQAQMEQSKEIEQKIAEADKELKQVRQQREALQKKMQMAEQDRKQFDPRKRLQGSVHLRNPLFVECNQWTVVIHPDMAKITLTELNKSAFNKVLNNHDGIVFLVRPQGFASFRKSFQLTQGLNLKTCYEPIDADWRVALAGEGK